MIGMLGDDWNDWADWDNWDDWNDRDDSSIDRSFALILGTRVNVSSDCTRD